jgi:hypothetical protein
MEYRRAYRDESPDRGLMERHEREIFPLLKRRRLFSGVERFLLYDLIGPGGVNENVFAYSNGDGDERALVLYNNAYARAEGRIRESCPYAEKQPDGGKRIARSDLAATLGLASGGRAQASSGSLARPRFCVMREQRSELWYIRRSREIADSGLQIILDGYQSQVFFDFFEVEDDERGLYSAVYDALGGRGTPDFSAAVQDVALKDLYALLAELARPLLAWAGELRFPSAGKKGTAAGTAGAAKKRAPNAVFIKSMGGPALAFYAKTRALMREEAAEEGLAGDREPAAATKGSARKAKAEDATGAARGAALAKKDEAAAKAAVKRLDYSLEAIAALAKTIGETTAAKRKAADEAASLLASEIAAPGALELCVSYAIFDGLKSLCADPAEEGTLREEASEGARRLLDRYCLDRKLREALRDAGMHGDEAYKDIAVAKTLLSKLGNQGLCKPAVAPIVGWASGDEDLRAILGVNLFGGVTWFNKERFEETARRAALYAAIGRERGDLDSARCAIELIEAAEKAGYSLDALAASYTAKEKEPKAKPRAKKATASRKTAPATTAAKEKAAPKKKATRESSSSKTPAKAKTAQPKAATKKTVAEKAPNAKTAAKKKEAGRQAPRAKDGPAKGKGRKKADGR